MSVLGSRRETTVSILHAHIASTSRATKMRTEGVEEDVVFALIEL